MSNDSIMKEADKKENGMLDMDEEKDSIKAKKKVQSDIKEIQEKVLENSAEEPEKETENEDDNDDDDNEDANDDDDDNEDANDDDDDNEDEDDDSKAEGELKLSLDDSKIEDEKDESLDSSKEEALDNTKESIDDSLEDEKESLVEKKSGTRKSTKKDTKQSEVKGKRERKKVEILSYEPKKEEVEVTGSGIPLGDITYISTMITKTPPEDLKVLHRMCYNRPGSAAEVRRNLKKFSGLGYTKDDKMFERKKQTVEKVFIPELKRILNIFGLERSGPKTDLVERILDFLLEPQDMGKNVPVKKAKRKRGKKQAKGTPAKRAKGDQGKSAADDDSSDLSNTEEEEEQNEDDDNDEGSEKEEKSDSSESEAEEPSPPKKTPRGKRAPTPKRTPKSTPKTAEKKKPNKKSEKSEDDLPLAKIRKPQAPTDSEIKSFIKRLLDKADLEEVTMKKVCQQVYDNYPKFDLAPKKDFIKETVRAILS